MMFNKSNENITFANILGCKPVIRALTDAVIAPRNYAQFFPNNPPASASNLILFGPPGNGKTMLAKAVANEMGTGSDFLSITSADILSKYVGESELKMRALFLAIRERLRETNGRPIVLFIDEMETLLPKREYGSKSDGSLNQFLIETDGMHSSLNKGLTIIGATNMPWSLDDALRRRFGKFVHVRLPTREERLALLKRKLGDAVFNLLTNNDISFFLKCSEGFSNSDLTNLAQDVLLMPWQWTQLSTHFKQIKSDEASTVCYVAFRWTPCSPDEEGAREMKFTDIEPALLKPPKITRYDVIQCIKSRKPSCDIRDEKGIVKLSEKFDEEYGIKLTASLDWGSLDLEPSYAFYGDYEIQPPYQMGCFESIIIFVAWFIDG